MLNDADAVILCLPDDAAREAVSLREQQRRIIDASTAHRWPRWTFGFPEMDAGQRATDRRLQPRIQPRLLGDRRHCPVPAAGRRRHAAGRDALTIFGISGYSGGGKSLIAAFEHATAANSTHDHSRLYAMGLMHKHVPEIMTYGGLTPRPLFIPSVGRFEKGMLV